MTEKIYLTAKCEHCTLAAWREISLNYFRGQDVLCPHCARLFNVEGLSELLQVNSFCMQSGFSLFDLKFSLKSAYIQPDIQLVVPKQELNIPENGKIVEVNCTSTVDETGDHGGLGVYFQFPEILNKFNHVQELYFYPIRLSNYAHYKKTKINIHVSWVENPEEEVLIHAYKNYIENQPQYSTVPLNVFIEARIKNFFEFLLVEALDGVDQKIQKNFVCALNEELPYSLMLKLFLPIVLKRFPEIQISRAMEILNTLNKLRTLRNQCGHNGKPKNPTDLEKFEKYFAAVILIRNLLDNFQENLGSSPNRGAL